VLVHEKTAFLYVQLLLLLGAHLEFERASYQLRLHTIPSKLNARMLASNFYCVVPLELNAESAGLPANAVVSSSFLEVGRRWWWQMWRELVDEMRRELVAGAVEGAGGRRWEGAGGRRWEGTGGRYGEGAGGTRYGGDGEEAAGGSLLGSCCFFVHNILIYYLLFELNCIMKGKLVQSTEPHNFASIEPPPTWEHINNMSIASQ
jgi:hypothetical protein